jgi:hypothetical protein
MKSILYIGATLMIGASIYGFVDYNKTRNKKEFKNMYVEKEVAQPADQKEKPIVSPEKNETAEREKKTADNKASVNNSITIANNITKFKKPKKRTFSTRLFSRGALDEKYIREEKIKPEEPKEKTEPSKTENKEQ